jgi:hypothetical protein
MHAQVYEASRRSPSLQYTQPPEVIHHVHCCCSAIYVHMTRRSPQDHTWAAVKCKAPKGAEIEPCNQPGETRGPLLLAPLIKLLDLRHVRPPHASSSGAVRVCHVEACIMRPCKHFLYTFEGSLFSEVTLGEGVVGIQHIPHSVANFHAQNVDGLLDCCGLLTV